METLITLAAKYFIILVVLGLGIAWLLTKRQRKLHFIISTILAGMIAFALARTLSYFIYIDRPFVVEGIKPLIEHAADNSFPSDHSLLAGTLAAITYFYNRKLALVMALLALAIGTARVLAHVHSPLDIAGAFAVGVIGAVAGYFLADLAYKRLNSSSQETE